VTVSSTSAKIELDRIAAAFSMLGILLLAYCYFPTLKRTALICWTNDDYSHGLILPAVALYILWDKKGKFLRILEKSSTSEPLFARLRGITLLVFGLILFFAGQAGSSLFIRWVSFFPCVLGFGYLVAEKNVINFLAPLFLLNFMAKPLPDSLIPKLFGPFQVFAAKVSAWVLDALNVPVYLIGNIIEIPGMRLMVEEACSGMRSLMALLTVALIVVLLIEISHFAKIVIILSSILVALTLNVVRVASTGVLAYFVAPETATGFFHTFSGMIVFIIGLAILYSLGIFLNRFAWARPKAKQ
jgi:exosortase